VILLSKEIIQKNLQVEPNMKDYDKTRQTFNWINYHDQVEWFGKNLNIAHNAIDRHAKTWRKNKVALYWEGNEQNKKFTFLELSNLSNKFANVLKDLGVVKGDRVFILLPRIPPLYISFLGALKTGAIAGTMFAAFGPGGIKDRLQDSEAKVLITDSELKKRVYEVKYEIPSLEHIIVVGKDVSEKEISYDEEMR
jgi:acetyl-CoA synthetase